MSLAARWRDRLNRIYPDRTEEAIAKLDAALTPVVSPPAQQPQERWSQRDVVMITYADILRFSEATPLATLNAWLLDEQLDQLINTVHLLPFCPYSSDDGFSVIDYMQVDPESGSWEDIAQLGKRFELMFDLVLNHISEHSEWFQAYLRGEAPFDQFFIEVDPTSDLSAVVRPRPGHPYKAFETNRGEKLVWSTFSAGEVKDQMDLNYAEPAVLAEMLKVLVEYANRGARIVRLDAVAFLWKIVGTSCLHLEPTHEVVKLCRDVLELAAPRTLVLTETNVPHAENVSYFGHVDPADGEGDEAHMVYNFSLPPLLLDAFASGDAGALRTWLEGLGAPPPGCTFFNFTASHDGIGVRPLEGLVPEERLQALVQYVSSRGGKVNMRRRPDGTESPYELNITYVDAMAPDPPQASDALHARRFLSSQAVAFALSGVPAVYFHSLVGTQNDLQAVEQSGQNRRINRHKYTLPELTSHLQTSGSLAQAIYQGYQSLIAARIAEPAFHPDAAQQVVDLEDPRLLGFLRTSLDQQRKVLVVVNFSAETVTFSLPAEGEWTDLLSQAPASDKLPAGGFAYLLCKAS